MNPDISFFIVLSPILASGIYLMGSVFLLHRGQYNKKLIVFQFLASMVLAITIFVPALVGSNFFLPVIATLNIAYWVSFFLTAVTPPRRNLISTRIAFFVVTNCTLATFLVTYIWVLQ
ncbi:hypothetical protein [Pseudohalocynthiibacter sp. F2068]|jgi:hypothetical protein|uniref:hypothetical protein n=1 Tax=Pseudohalocynthiibacter sp. F2068 TaxID=2926418 RepID=UPI001FF1F570|nr:hypothetical protein [Pseudohalocynthiibacter sp. F2068]MCK0101744.1 hypothetical protein [Pseudohalocynthiibacter sp. F2068]